MKKEKDPLLLEIQEEVNRDRLMNALKKFSPIIMVSALIIVVAFGGYEAWKFYKTENSKKEGTVIYSAMNSSDVKTLEKENFSGDTDAIAKLTEAGIKVKNGEIDEAVKAYNKLAESKSADLALHDLAVLNKSSLLLNLGNEDATVRKDLTEISASGRPFRHSALEMLGTLELKSGNQEAATKIFQDLAKDKNTPFGISSRAKQMAN